MIGTITLNPSLDHNWIVENFVKDDTNRVKTLIETPGGKGINVSKVIRELGGETRAFALLGGPMGEHLRGLARPLDFPLSAVRIAGNTRVNIVLTDIKDGTQTRISASGPDVSDSELKMFTRMLCRVRPRPDVWAFGGSLPPNVRPSVYRELVKTLQDNGTPCVLDADGAALKLGLSAKPFMIKPNEFEMQRLCGKKLGREGDYLREARRLVRAGVRHAVVSLAAKGALFVSETAAFHVSTPKVRVRSHVGAGDSLIGGFLWALSQRMPVREAAKTGVAASTSAVMREEPRLCRRSDIPGLMRRLKVREL
jgi:1-phosphofructokinase family hexose kinase